MRSDPLDFPSYEHIRFGHTHYHRILTRSSRCAPRPSRWRRRTRAETGARQRGISKMQHRVNGHDKGAQRGHVESDSNADSKV